MDRNVPVTIEHVFPKMIDGTQKHEIPSKFTKRAVRNEFRRKSQRCCSFPLPFDIIQGHPKSIFEKYLFGRRFEI